MAEMMASTRGNNYPKIEPVWPAAVCNGAPCPLECFLTDDHTNETQPHQKSDRD